MTIMDMAEFKLREEFFGLRAQPLKEREESKQLVRMWQTIKRITLMCLLAGSFMFYYVLDKMNQALTVL
ncbi:MAG: hypothetical protein AMJ67_03355 [Betaproteobacteria bacterium SG8_41]|jgi:hypothetical protein|nr:MAG: hypothetical protein AMJ67_03355 [Betaproteobacteria bacterium SG8_41]